MQGDQVLEWGTVPEVQLPCLQTRALPARGEQTSNPRKVGTGGPGLGCPCNLRTVKAGPVEPDLFFILGK